MKFEKLTLEMKCGAFNIILKENYKFAMGTANIPATQVSLHV
jgi:hypothetical protein